MTSAPPNIPDAHTFYNNPQQQGLKERDESRILYMRNFNNWIKSTLISKYKIAHYPVSFCHDLHSR